MKISQRQYSEFISYKDIRLQFNHNQIVKTYHLEETERSLYFMQEIAHNGDLHNYVLYHGCLQEEEARYIFNEICSGIRYCHARDISHQDLKLKNIMLDGKMNIKIGGIIIIS